MPLIVPLQPVPSQIVQVNLNDQICQIEVYQLSTGLFVNLFVANSLIIGGVIALDRNVIVRSAYLGFSGDIAFVDIEGTEDPVYTGIGTRFVLVYIFPNELPPGLA